MRAQLRPLSHCCPAPLSVLSPTTLPSWSQYIPFCLIMFELHLGPMNQLEIRPQKKGPQTPSGQCLAHCYDARVSPSTWLGQQSCPFLGEGELLMSELWPLLLGSYFGQLLEPENKFLFSVSWATWDIQNGWLWMPPSVGFTDSPKPSGHCPLLFSWE